MGIQLNTPIPHSSEDKSTPGTQEKRGLSPLRPLSEMFPPRNTAPVQVSGVRDDVVALLARREPQISDLRGEEGMSYSPRTISEMSCTVCEDNQHFRLIIQQIVGKMGFKAVNPALDTRPNGRVESVIEAAENEALGSANIIFNDINDTDDTTDPSGGIRRAKLALESKNIKFVVFMTGNGANEDIINNEFESQYGGRYIFVKKPFDENIVAKQIADMVTNFYHRRGELGILGADKIAA